MASFFHKLATIFILLLSSASCEIADDFLVTERDHKPMKQKLTHLRLYFHDILSGRAPTAVPILVPKNVTFWFGLVVMFDDRLTLGPKPSSKEVGRAQGFYSFASQEELSVLMTMNFVFNYGKYNGSSITIVGRNAILDKERELPVIGGSGIFRFARGFAKIRAVYLNLKTKDAIVEYNISVIHY